MTRVVWEHWEQTPQYEDVVSVLISRLSPAAERIDGSGGDGGRDVQLRSPGRLDLFEAKSFTGRVSDRSPNRRRQVEDSLRVAAGLQPDSWTLVVPINPTPAELRWFDGLRDEYPFPLFWNGRDWLDSQMAAFPDVRRYYFEGAADEVVRLLRNLKAEGEPVEDVDDALGRFRRLRARLDDIDPQYKIEISPGPVAAAVIAFPGAVMYQEATEANGDVWTVSVLAKYRDAPSDRPLQLSANLRFDETAASLQERESFEALMKYGADEPVVVQNADDLVMDGPAGLGGSHSSGILRIASIPEEIELSARLEISAPDGSPLASLSLSFDRRHRGTDGVTLVGDHESGFFSVQVRAAADLTASVNVAVHPVSEYLPLEAVPILRALSTVTAPNQVAVAVAGKPLADRQALPEIELVSSGFVRLVEAIARVQAETHTHFRIRDDLTADDVSRLNRIIRLLDGGEVGVLARSDIDFVAPGVAPALGEELPQIAVQFWHEEDFLGHDVPMGACVSVGGPYRVESVEELEEGGSRVRLSPLAEARSVLRRGAIIDAPVTRGGPAHVLVPARAPQGPQISAQ